MKTTKLIVAALAAGFVAGSATALNVKGARAVRVNNTRLTLGALTFTPLGVDGQYCDYLADWASPFNPNDVKTCFLQELRTSFAPSCLANSSKDILTVVQSGPACEGFDLVGQGGGASLVLGEAPDGSLTGVAVIDKGGAGTVYPVTVNAPRQRRGG